jgi:hypothetical protein
MFGEIYFAQPYFAGEASYAPAINNPKNATQWIDARLFGYVSGSLNKELTTQSSIGLQTQSGVELIVNPNLVTKQADSLWTHTPAS